MAEYKVIHIFSPEASPELRTMHLEFVFDFEALANPNDYLPAPSINRPSRESRLAGKQSAVCLRQFEATHRHSEVFNIDLFVMLDNCMVYPPILPLQMLSSTSADTSIIRLAPLYAKYRSPTELSPIVILTSPCELALDFAVAVYKGACIVHHEESKLICIPNPLGQYVYLTSIALRYWKDMLQDTCKL
ncbi:hypothetical protein VKT23_015308 [Stygiomarasmius scandens]|uniref:Uncharacterized protein n=1 Tax=Marasmiellus scandens TaxID=2682957 RepID=A0ABR1IY37_9AGAR